MRPIKFRAARYTDGVLEKIYDVTGIDYDEDFDVYNARLKNNEWIINVIPLQYTGLKDKNGVEIYEGDILEVEKNEDGTYKGTIDGNTFFDRFQGYSSKIKVDGVYDINNIRYWNNHVEVIGNVYENPELLEEMEE